MNRAGQNLSKNIFCGLVSLIIIFVGLASAAQAGKENLLRIAVLPIPDVLPIYVAEENGYFDELGIAVEPLAVGSAVERDQLMQASRIDGMINEVSGAALFNRDEVKMKIVSYARIPLDEAPLFRVLAAPKSGITNMSELKGSPVAVSRNTVIEYITRRLFEKNGVTGDDIKFASVPVLPERMQLLLSGQIKAATLPDPLGFSALQAGAVEVTTDLQLPELSASVISFSAEVVADKSETVAKFMKAWDRAAEDLNKDPEKYRPLMLKKIRVPKNVQQSFVIPPFPRGKVPTPAQWDDVTQWLLEQGLLKKEVSYDISVTPEFVQ